MSILLLVAAVLCWLIAAIPVLEAALHTLVGWIAFGWAGLFLFGAWLLVGGAQHLLAFVQRPRA